jgi:hypothetical protein
VSDPAEWLRQAPDRREAAAKAAARQIAERKCPPAEADEKVARFILRDFREEVGRWSSEAEKHLAECADAKAAHVDGSNGTYGCDTGCSYARLEAEISCPHGFKADHMYGDFGEIADMLQDIVDDETAIEGATDE